MRKIQVAMILLLLAIIASVWILLSGFLAPFGSENAGQAAILFFAGLASLAAAVVAAIKPRQILVLAIALALTIAHSAFWLLIINVALHERHVL